MSIKELDHNLAGGAGQELKEYDEAAAMDERIIEWLETPEGTVADLPSWGNRLSSVRHNPPDAAMARTLRHSIVVKLPQDVADLRVTGIAIEPREIDLVAIGIQYQLAGGGSGLFVGETSAWSN